jgi:hypothetical protein
VKEPVLVQAKEPVLVQVSVRVLAQPDLELAQVLGSAQPDLELVQAQGPVDPDLELDCSLVSALQVSGRAWVLDWEPEPGSHRVQEQE